MSTQNPPAPTARPTERYERPTINLHRSFTETKAGFKTTEFYVMLVFVAGVLRVQPMM